MALNPVTAGAQNLGTVQVTVATSATLLVTARPKRRSVLIVNAGGTAKVYVGTSAVSITTGSYLPAADGASVSIPTTAEIWAIASASQVVSVMEVFD